MNKKKTGIAIAVLVLVIAVFAGIYLGFAPKAVAGSKQVTVEIVHADGTSKEFVCDTEAEYLGDVLKAEKLVEGEDGPYGLYIKTADGETVDDANQEWWCLTKDGGQVNTSADQTPIQDGEHYELTFTVGY